MLVQRPISGAAPRLQDMRKPAAQPPRQELRFGETSLYEVFLRRNPQLRLTDQQQETLKSLLNAEHATVPLDYHHMRELSCSAASLLKVVSPAFSLESLAQPYIVARQQIVNLLELLERQHAHFMHEERQKIEAYLQLSEALIRQLDQQLPDKH